MRKLLLIVEDAFQITGRGLVLTPDINVEAVQNRPLNFTAPVMLRRPDGAESEVEAFIGVEFFFPKGSRRLCTLKGVEKAQCPAGTEVWIDTD